MATYTIGKLAHAAGIPTTTVRYYERRGLLQAEKRSDGNYRLFTEATLERLRFIQAAQGAGFTLNGIASLLELKEQTAAPNREVRGLIEQRLREVGEQIRHLRQVELTLEQWRSRCHNGESAGRCEVTGSTAQAAAIIPPTPRNAEPITQQAVIGGQRTQSIGSNVNR